MAGTGWLADRLLEETTVKLPIETRIATELHTAMTLAQHYAQYISVQIPLIKSGTLRIWGEWFGRPFDNIHRIVAANADGDRLILEFNEGETLTIFEPDGVTCTENNFFVHVATRVRWEWFLYGEDHSPENLRFLDYFLGPEGCTLRTNWRFNKPPNQTPTGPAVELV